MQQIMLGFRTSYTPGGTLINNPTIKLAGKFDKISIYRISDSRIENRYVIEATRRIFSQPMI